MSGFVRGRFIVLALIVLLFAGSAMAIYYGVISRQAVPEAGPGVLLSLRLYDVNVEEKKVVDVTSILERPDVLLSVEVNALTPPGSRWTEDIVPIFRDTVKGKREVYIRSEEFSEIARGWVSLYKSRGGDPESTYSGLIIRIFIINSTTKEILFNAYDSISYKPAEVAKGKTMKIYITMARGLSKFAEVNVEYE